MKGVVTELLRWVYPKRCVACEVLGEQLCPQCSLKIKKISGPCCLQCGMPFVGSAVSRVCPVCSQDTPHYDFHRSVFLFEGVVQQLIHGFKYHHRFWLTDFWRESCEFLSTEFSQADAVVAVPLHKSRLRERGYNQSELLARMWARLLSKPLKSRFLTRVRQTPSQTGLDKAKRLQNMSGAFSVADLQRFRGQTVLLVDDVHTTGVTLNAAALALKEAGCQRVIAFSLAMVEKHL